MAPTPQPGLIVQMMEARETCRELMGVLVQENADMANNHNTTQVEARLALKKRLALRLEKLLADIKAQKDAVRGNKQVENLALQLAEEIAAFQDIAAKNEVMLRAAHHIRADIVTIIRDTIEASQPRLQTYGKMGENKTGSTGGSVVGTTI